MPAPRSTHVEVYVFRRSRTRAQLLVLRRASGERLHPGIWQPVTGRRRRIEGPLAAAVREVREETGLEPRRWWGLETATLYVDVRDGQLKILPLLAAEVDPKARVRLSREHDAFEWVSLAEAARRVLWESQRRGITALQREVLCGGPLAAALELERVPAPPPRRAT